LSPSLRAIRWRLILTSLVALVLALGSFYLNQWVYASSDDQCSWRVQGRQVLIQEILPNGAAVSAVRQSLLAASGGTLLALDAAIVRRREIAREAARAAVAAPRHARFQIDFGEWLESRGWRRQEVSEESARLFGPVAGPCPQYRLASR